MDTWRRKKRIKIWLKINPQSPIQQNVLHQTNHVDYEKYKEENLQNEEEFESDSLILEICNKSFASKKGLKIHVNKVYENAGSATSTL